MVDIHKVLDAHGTFLVGFARDLVDDVVCDLRDATYFDIGAIEHCAFVAGADQTVFVDLVVTADQVAEHCIVVVEVFDHVAHGRHDLAWRVGSCHFHRFAIVIERSRFDRLLHTRAHITFLCVLLCLLRRDDGLTSRGLVRRIEIASEERVGFDNHADVVEQVDVILVEQQRDRVHVATRTAYEVSVVGDMRPQVQTNRFGTSLGNAVDTERVFERGPLCSIHDALCPGHVDE